MEAKKATFKKTETNSVQGFLEDCIKHNILTVTKARAIYSAVRDLTVDAMVIEVYPSGTVFVQRYRTTKSGETYMYQGHMHKQSKTITFELAE